MKRLTNKSQTLLCLFLFFSGSIISQSTIMGTVTEEDSTPIPFANILLLNPADSSLIKGAITDIDGQYIIENIENGAYLLAFTSVGYQIKYDGPFDINNGNSEINKGAIKILKASTDLTTATITAKKPMYEQKIDRLVVNVSNSITSSGGTALQVLERSPGVTVNKLWGRLTLNGKDGVLIMVNGKISRMPANAVVQMLDGMSADNIEKIELIHTPPSNFEAEGDAGIIHIILKENSSRGLNGTYSANIGYGLKEKYGANLNFNFRKNNINIYGDYAHSFTNNPQLFQVTRSYEWNNQKIESFSSQDRDPTRLHVHQARLGADFQLTDKTIVGGLVGWLDRHWKMDAFTNVENKIDGTTNELIELPNDEENHWQHVLGNVNLQHKFSESSTINFDVDYAYYSFKNPSNYHNQFFTSERILTDENKLRVTKSTPMGIFANKVDFTKDINKNIRWESGIKTTATQFENDISVDNNLNGAWLSDSLYTAKHEMEENIFSAYTSFTIKINEQSNFKGGLRYEYTQTQLGTIERPDIIDRKYGNLFPTLFYTNNLNENNQIQFSFGRRISRPDFTQLAPFFVFFDPGNILTGNPELQPSITNIGNINYRWKTIQFGIQYNYEDEAIVPFQPSLDIENNVQLLGAKNFDYVQSANISLAFPIQVTPWWEIRNNISGQWQKVRNTEDELPTEASQKSWNYNGSMNFSFPKNFSAELSGYYRSKILWGGLEFQRMGQLNLGIQKELANKRGTIKFNITDILFTNNFKVSQSFNQYNYQYDGFYRLSERIYRVTYSRNFGNAKLKEARTRETSTEEERKRVN